MTRTTDRYRSRIGTSRDLSSSRSAGQTAGHRLCAEFWSGICKAPRTARRCRRPDPGASAGAAVEARTAAIHGTDQPKLEACRQAAPCRPLTAGAGPAPARPAGPAGSRARKRWKGPGGRGASMVMCLFCGPARTHRGSRNEYSRCLSGRGRAGDRDRLDKRPVQVEGQYLAVTGMIRRSGYRRPP
jgi:hypothetical protein